MAKERHGFLIYHEWKPNFDLMSDTQLRTMINSLFAFSMTLEEPDFGDDIVMKALWNQFSYQLKSDFDTYEEQKKAKSEAGKKGGLASGESRRTSKQNEANEAVLQNQSSASETKQRFKNEANEHNSSYSSNCNSNHTDIDKDTYTINNNSNNISSCSSNVSSGITTTTADFLDIEFVAKKILSLQKWKPDTSKFIAEKFINLNSDNVSKGWGTGIWESRLSGFLRDERTPEDYKKWKKQQEESKHTLSKEKLRSLMASWERSNPSALAEDRRNAYEIWRDYNEIHHPDQNWESLPGVSNSTFDAEGIPCVITPDNMIHYHGGKICELNDDLPFG